MWNDLMGYIRKSALLIAALLLCLLLSLFMFWLYALPMEPIVYTASLCACILLVAFCTDFLRMRMRLTKLRSIRAEHGQTFPITHDPVEIAYQQMVASSQEAHLKATTKLDLQQSETLAYFTMWVHQIKTPIAAMHMLIPPGAEAQVLELRKVEQYVEMVLGYLRLDSITSDLSFHSFDVDNIVRQAVRKLAPFFVYKRIALVYDALDKRVLTDEKWLAFVLEQVLSNALKYTREGGSITIAWTEPDTLIVRDTGIGIRSEDVPRVFEKGFTGYNGRMDKKSTGIGLYLCGQVMRRLSHGISIVSTPQVGAEVRLDLSTIDLKPE